MTQIAVGQYLDEWVVEEPLGEGAFAQVFRGKHASHQHHAALKVPTDPRYVDRLRIDPRALQLEHSHIVRAQELHLEHDPPFVVLDLVEGGNLREAMHLEHLSWDRISKIVEQLAAALDHAHDRGVLHLDLKPENVLIDTRGEVRLTDFGVVPPGSKEVLAQSLLLSAELGVVGTRDYAAPEMRSQAGTLDRRTDVYGLGVVAFELLTGRLPIGLDRPSQLRPNLPPAVDDVLGAALARDPARRPTSAGAFAAQLRQALKVEDEASERPAPKGAMSWLAVAVGVLLLGVLGAVAMRSSGEPEPGWTLRKLWTDVPPGEPVTLLPIEGVGEGTKPAVRAVRATIDRALLSDGHTVYHPEITKEELKLADLWDNARRAAIVEQAGSRWAILASTLAGSGDPVQDALYALVDLESFVVLSARPARDLEAENLGGNVAGELANLPDGAVGLSPTYDADLGVRNFSTARFDDEFLCALVAKLDEGHPLLVDFTRMSAELAGKPLPIRYTVEVELDSARGEARALIRDLHEETTVGDQGVIWTAPQSYDPTAGATRLTSDRPRLAKLAEQIQAAEAEVLKQAEADRMAGKPAAAVKSLNAFRARGESYARRVEVLVALGEARRAAGSLEEGLEHFREALVLDPQRADLRERFATICFEEASELFAGGKGSWYQNDDEDSFGLALELLELTTGMTVSPELRTKIDALSTKVRREL